VHAINKFRHCITGYDTFIHIGNYASKYLMKKPISNGRIIRWLLLLQEFNITILDIPKKENVVACFLSRIHNKDELILVNYNFSNENLF